MKHIFKKIQSPLRSIGKTKKSKTQTHILNNIEIRSFKKRKKRVFFGFLRKFNIQISQEHTPYYVASWIGAIILLWILILFSPYLNVHRIEILRDSSYVDLNMAYTSVDTIRWKKIFSLDTQNIAKNIINFQNNIDLVTIKLILPDRVDIQLVSSPAVFSTFLRKKSYIIVENGTLVPSNTVSENLINLEIYGDIEDSNDFIDYKKTLRTEELQKIFAIQKSLRENLLTLNIANLHYFVTQRELAVEINGGMLIFFDLTKDITPQIEKLVVFSKENADITNNTIIYIDNRISNKVFYCDIETEFTCRNNIKNIYWDIKQIREKETLTFPLDADPS